MLAQLASGATATEHALMGHVTGAGQLGLHAGTIHGAWAAECLRAMLRAELAAGFARRPQA